MKKKKIKLGFVGLTHLGLNYLAASVEKNFSTLGIDSDVKKITNLNNGIIEIKEPSLKKIILNNKKKNFIF